MPEIGGIEYDDEAYAHMQRLHEDYKTETDPKRKAALRNEAEVIHAFHVEFPGVKWHEPLPDPTKNRIGKFSDPARSGAPPTQRLGALAVYPRSGTQRARVLEAIACSQEGISDEQLNNLLGIGIRQCSARRNELMDEGWVTDSGRTTTSSAGVEVALWVLTEAGSAQWERPQLT